MPSWPVKLGSFSCPYTLRRCCIQEANIEACCLALDYLAGQGLMDHARLFSCLPLSYLTILLYRFLFRLQEAHIEACCLALDHLADLGLMDQGWRQRPAAEQYHGKPEFPAGKGCSYVYLRSPPHRLHASLDWVIQVLRTSQISDFRKSTAEFLW